MNAITHRLAASVPLALLAICATGLAVRAQNTDAIYAAA